MGPQANGLLSIVQRTPEIKRQRLRHSSNGEDLCTICNIIQPKGARHCEWCHVCVAGYDHHCPWVGKCVGSENLKAFYAFLTVSFTTLFFMVASTLVFSPWPSEVARSPVHRVLRP